MKSVYIIVKCHSNDDIQTKYFYLETTLEGKNIHEIPQTFYAQRNFNKMANISIITSLKQNVFIITCS